MKLYHQITLFVLYTSILFGQSIHVPLPVLSRPDNRELHLTLFYQKPKEQLILPEINHSTFSFFDLYHSSNIRNDEMISCIVLHSDSLDILYVDRNNDENLTNDGGPILFPRSLGSLYVDIINDEDPKQIVKLVLYRTPDAPDSLSRRYVDQYGNLTPSFAAYYTGIIQTDEATGKRGTFFFDDRVSLRHGILELNKEKIRIGLFDYDNNGYFNDSDDVVMIDLNGDQEIRFGDGMEIFYINETFTLNDSHYTLSEIDRYGTWLEVKKTNTKPKFLLLQHRRYPGVRGFTTGVLDSSFWSQSVVSLEGIDIPLNPYRGKYLLLNFWGEWCGPCISEIPDLMGAYRKYDRLTLEMLGIMKIHDRTKAISVIKKYSIPWKQAELSAELEKQFNIRGYPTNILIAPDGKIYVHAVGTINKTFFEQHIH